jgi:F0F1-type ATP synthase membrane subunit b/b'
MLIPARAFNIIVLWLYTAGGVGVILLFFALFMLSINRYASERIHELGYTGVFSKPGFLYGTAALAWGTIFGIVGYYIFGLGGAFMAFLVGAIIGMILVFIEVRRAKVAPKVAEIEKKLFEKLEDIRKQIGILAKERESLQAQLQKMLEEGRAAGDPELIAIQRQIDAVDEQIRSLRLQMEKERETAETEEMRRRVVSGS